MANDARQTTWDDLQQGLRADRTTLKQRRTTDTAPDEETNTNRSEGGGASGQAEGTDRGTIFNFR